MLNLEARLLGIAASVSDAVVDDEHAQIMSLAGKVNLAVVGATVTAIEAGLTAHGIAGLAESGIRKQLTAAEPGMVAALTTEESQFLDSVDVWLKALVAKNS